MAIKIASPKKFQMMIMVTMKRDEIEDKTLSFTESLKMLDKINKCSFLDEVIKSTVTKKLENLQLQNKK